MFLIIPKAQSSKAKKVENQRAPQHLRVKCAFFAGTLGALLFLHPLFFSWNFFYSLYVSFPFGYQFHSLHGFFEFFQAQTLLYLFCLLVFNIFLPPIMTIYFFYDRIFSEIKSEIKSYPNFVSLGLRLLKVFKFSFDTSLYCSLFYFLGMFLAILFNALFGVLLGFYDASMLGYMSLYLLIPIDGFPMIIPITIASLVFGAVLAFPGLFLSSLIAHRMTLQELLKNSLNKTEEIHK